MEQSLGWMIAADLTWQVLISGLWAVGFSLCYHEFRIVNLALLGCAKFAALAFFLVVSMIGWEIRIIAIGAVVSWVAGVSLSELSEFACIRPSLKVPKWLITFVLFGFSILVWYGEPAAVARLALSFGRNSIDLVSLEQAAYLAEGHHGIAQWLESQRHIVIGVDGTVKFWTGIALLLPYTVAAVSVSKGRLKIDRAGVDIPVGRKGGSRIGAAVILCTCAEILDVCIHQGMSLLPQANLEGLPIIGLCGALIAGQRSRWVALAVVTVFCTLYYFAPYCIYAVLLRYLDSVPSRTLLLQQVTIVPIFCLITAVILICRPQSGMETVS